MTINSVYATYATGFRSGGFNGVGGRPFDAETLENFELGYKSTWLDDRLRLNAAVFRSRSDDYQFFYIDFNQGGAQVIDNLSEVEFHGRGDRVAGAAPRAGTLLGSVGVLDSDIKFDPTLTVPTASAATAHPRRRGRVLVRHAVRVSGRVAHGDASASTTTAGARSTGTPTTSTCATR